MTTRQGTKKSKTKNEKSSAAVTEAASASHQVPVSSAPAEDGLKEKTSKPKKAAKSKKTATVDKPSKASAVKASTTLKTGTDAAKAGKAPSRVGKAVKGIPKSKSAAKAGTAETAKVLDSVLAYEGPLFRVLRDHIIEPGGRESYRDVILHNGSVVILAIDPGKKKKDPWIVIERQYRHAAGQFLWELPAGKLDAGETPVDGAKRELSEETGYQAKKWSQLVEYFASPGFLGESMKVFLAEGLVAGDAHPEDDEHIDFRLVKLSEVLELVDKGKIIDGKTLTSVLLYARQLGVKRKS
jgi:ADP-ribose pyrophosphatase